MTDLPIILSIPLDELELRRGEGERAPEHFQMALAKARNPMERSFFQQRILACERPSVQLTAFWEPDLEPSQVSDREDER